MTDTQLTIVVASLPATLSAVAACLAAWRAGSKVQENSAKVEDLHMAINSKLDKERAALILATKEQIRVEVEAAFAKGKLAEATRARAETATAPLPPKEPL